MVKKFDSIRAMVAVVTMGYFLLNTVPLMAQTINLRQVTCDPATAAVTNKDILSALSLTDTQLILPAGSLTINPFTVTGQSNLIIEGTVDQGTVQTTLSFPTGSVTGLTLQDSFGTILKNLKVEGPVGSELVVLQGSQGPGVSSSLSIDNYLSIVGGDQVYPNCLSDDSDIDGISDRIEVTTCTDPNNADSDSDGLNDGIEDANQDGIRDQNETDPCQADSDGDGVDDNLDNCPLMVNPAQVDVNGNGIGDLCQYVRVVFDLPVSDKDDNAKEKVTDGIVITGINPIKMRSNYVNGLRFLNPALPPGTYIDMAYLQLTAHRHDSGSTSLTIEGEAVADAQPFIENDYNITSRSKTIANVSWSPDAWLVNGEYDAAQQTPNLKPVIQEIIGQPGWASDNAMALIVTTSSGVRRAEAYVNNLDGNGPVLHLECLIPIDVQDYPEAKDDDINIPIDTETSIAVLADNGNGSDSDANGSLDPASVTLIRGPVNGVITHLNPDGTISYLPNPGFNGIDHFSYNIRDNDGAISNTAMVNVTVGEVQPPPSTTCCDVATTGSYFEAEEYNVLGNNWEVAADSDTSGGNFLNSVINNEDGVSPIGEAAEYHLNFTETGTYYIWFRAKGSRRNSLFYGIDFWSGGDARSRTQDIWNWTNDKNNGIDPPRVTIYSTGPHRLKIWSGNVMKLDGFYLIKDGGAVISDPVIPAGSSVCDPTSCN
jgi:hypothetical protein